MELVKAKMAEEHASQVAFNLEESKFNTISSKLPFLDLVLSLINQLARIPYFFDGAVKKLKQDASSE